MRTGLVLAALNVAAIAIALRFPYAATMLIWTAVAVATAVLVWKYAMRPGVKILGPTGLVVLLSWLNLAYAGFCAWAVIFIHKG